MQISSIKIDTKKNLNPTFGFGVTLRAGIFMKNAVKEGIISAEEEKAIRALRPVCLCDIFTRGGKCFIKIDAPISYNNSYGSWDELFDGFIKTFTTLRGKKLQTVRRGYQDLSDAGRLVDITT